MGAPPAAVPPGAPDGEAAFDLLYTAELGRLTAALQAMGASRSTAEEVAQDAFVHAWARWSSVLRSPSPAGWVYVTAFRMLRRRHRRRAALLHPVSTRDHSDTTGDRLDLVGALGRLPEPHREVVVLRHLLGLSTTEVAIHLGLREGTVRARLHRAVTALRADLGPLETTEASSRLGGARRG